MIITIIGGIGSGKTLTAVKHIIDDDSFCFTNFRLRKFKNYHRIAYDDVIIKAEKLKDYRVNWGFWDAARENNKKFSIYLDEVHNIMSSRKAMSKDNILISRWLSQIRKILSDSKHNHLYIISQTARKIDVDARDLTQVFIKCRKVEKGNDVYIINDYFFDKNFINYELIGRPFARKFFKGNAYFKYYDTEEMVKFGDVDEFL